MERVHEIEGTDLLKLAEVTLPLPNQQQLLTSFDTAKQAWVFASPNPNLRVIGNFNAPVAPGMNGFGFAVGIMTSLLNVAGLHGRYFLRDGYHRAYGLLASGIRYVPALVANYSAIEAVGLPPQGMLPQDAYLGDRPALLTDYLNDEVAADTTVQSNRKVIVLQALEMNVFD